MTRAAFFRLHSWLGIVTGACMLAIAWSGVARRLQRRDRVAAESGRARRPRPGRASARRGGGSDSRPPSRSPVRGAPADRATLGPYGVRLRGPHQRFLQIDPATAVIRRDDLIDGYTFNVAYFLRQLHVRLLMGFWGRVFVGVFGVTLVLSIVTSLWIYREWLRSLVRVRRADGRRIFHMDVHKAVGLWTLAFNLMFGVTGAVLGLENLYYRIWPAAPRSPAVFAPAPPLAAPLTPEGPWRG